MAAYYNEIDPKIAAWLRELIRAGVLAPGEVDQRDIRDVRPDELARYTQCHFFAGIGVWSYALRLAGWPDDRPVWTGSCPCQPFSTAGGRAGLADERHLWPSWFHLIQQRRPDVVFGEQVSGGDGLAWLDVVRPDLEGAAYSVWCADLCSPGVGAPNIRQRIFFVADTNDQGCEARSTRLTGDRHRAAAERNSGAGRLADSDGASASRLGEERGTCSTAQWIRGGPADRCKLGDASGPGLPVRQLQELHGTRWWEERRTAQQSGRTFWTGADWLPCRDGRARPVEPWTFPLANGAPARVLRLRGYGNTINAEVAAVWIAQYMSLGR